MSRRKITISFGVVLALLFVFSSFSHNTSASDNAAESRFIGGVQSLPATANFIGDWLVSCHTVHVGPATAINQSLGRVRLGAFVAVEGTLRPDGSIAATKVIVVPVLLPLPVTCPPPSASPTPTPSPRPFPLPPPCFDFFGVIGGLPAGGLIGDWNISHRTVHVTATTVLKQEQGPATVGALVVVKGCLRTDGSIDASLIEVRRRPIINLPPFPFFELFGVVNTLPPAPFIGDWDVAGRTVHVTSSTRLEPMFRPLVVGSLVRVLGGLNNDGSINANRIWVLRNGDTGRHVNFFELFGTVQVLAPPPTFVGDWMVSGLTVHVNGNTRIAQSAERPLAVGARVLIVGTQRPDLSLNAARVVVLRPVNTPQAFVSQNYADFLNRDPDAGGLSFWADQISKCGSDAGCVEDQRVSVSAAFFLSTEFQQTGYFVYRFYQASFGRQPQFVEFIPDTQTVAQNIDAGVAQLEANKQAFADDWVSHPAFTAMYDGLTNAEYVDTLYANAGVMPGQLERDALVAGLDSGSETRATALQKVVDNPAFSQQEFNRAFVLMQYFGYLRRDPDQEGYNFWVNIMNQLNGDFRQAQMVKAFIDSAEYNQRFGPQ